jgi:hypothetical protein
MIGKKRLALAAGSVTAAGAVATLVAGTTFGLFAASDPLSDSSFTAGTVSLDNTASAVCDVSPMVPGDSSSGYSPTPDAQTDPQTDPCTFTVAYTGSAPAWVALDLTEVATGLYDGTADGLQFQISDGTVSYTTDGVLNGTNLLISTSALTNGDARTFTVNYALPRTSGNDYQGLSAELQMTVHAVQAGNNALPVSCTTAGSPCAATGTFAWS